MLLVKAAFEENDRVLIQHVQYGLCSTGKITLHKITLELQQFSQITLAFAFW